jgi:hypothetical protein
MNQTAFGKQNNWNKEQEMERKKSKHTNQTVST